MITRARIERVSDDALLRYERLLDRAIEREEEKVSAAVDDPMTRHYGIGGEVAELVGRRGRELDQIETRVWIEKERRGL